MTNSTVEQIAATPDGNWEKRDHRSIGHGDRDLSSRQRVGAQAWSTDLCACRSKAAGRDPDSAARIGGKGCSAATVVGRIAQLKVTLLAVVAAGAQVAMKAALSRSDRYQRILN